MAENKFNIVVVDDTMGKTDPFIVELKLSYAQVAEVSYFSDVQSAIDFVDCHMSERMIIFMDCKFGSVWQGIDAVQKLRKKTALIYVVMMSANNLDQLDSKDIASLINTDNIFFIKNSDTDGAKYYVEKIRSLWQSQFDCILESWLTRHPEDSEKVAFSEAGGKSYTWGDILTELRLQTPIGKKMEQLVNQYYIYEYTNQ